MFWLDFNLSLSDEFEVEKQVRYIQASTDIDELRTIATELLRFATVQAHVSNQLVTQVAEIEARMGCPVTAEHEAWAADLLAQRACNHHRLRGGGEVVSHRSDLPIRPAATPPPHGSRRGLRVPS